MNELTNRQQVLNQTTSNDLKTQMSSISAASNVDSYKLENTMLQHIDTANETNISKIQNQTRETLINFRKENTLEKENAEQKYMQYQDKAFELSERERVDVYSKEFKEKALAKDAEIVKNIATVKYGGKDSIPETVFNNYLEKNNISTDVNGNIYQSYAKSMIGSDGNVDIEKLTSDTQEITHVDYAGKKSTFVVQFDHFGNHHIVGTKNSDGTISETVDLNDGWKEDLHKTFTQAGQQRAILLSNLEDAREAEIARQNMLDKKQQHYERLSQAAAETANMADERNSQIMDLYDSI